MGVSSSSKEKLEDYEAFVEKFKPKLTTDDCFTPPAVYDAVLEWVRDKYDLGDAPIVRPFRPGGDYQSEEYPKDCVVVDNPPFSILAFIRRWYTAHGIKYFLFAPALTSFIRDPIDCLVGCNATVIYANGANVKTSFVTNLDTVNAVITAPTLAASIALAQKKEHKKPLAKYDYPRNVLMATHLGKLVDRGQEIEIPYSDVSFTRVLDSQKPLKRALYGSGYLVSNRVANRIEELMKAPFVSYGVREEGERFSFDLSERELAIIRELDGKTKQSERGEEPNA